MPSRGGMYFVLALCLFPGVGYLRAWGKLVAGLGPLGSWTPSEKALRELWRHLGPAPLRELFEVVAGPVGRPSTRGSVLPGLADSRLRRVQFAAGSGLPPGTRSAGERRRHCVGEEGYPHVRLMALCETGTRALLGAVFGPTDEEKRAGRAPQLGEPRGDVPQIRLHPFGGEQPGGLSRLGRTGLSNREPHARMPLGQAPQQLVGMRHQPRFPDRLRRPGRKQCAPHVIRANVQGIGE
ncbi:transposase domain-containing protein [Streptomyces asiaticus]|uniref:transposase domain-containing protein n=1 Tax=Streptomyces asiaticus TaxID=114695 RepID=UPI003F6691FA